MIRGFRNNATKAVYAGKTRVKGIPAQVLRRAVDRLLMLESARDLNELRFPPSNRLEALSGDREGQYSIRINQQWRVCFRWDSGHAYDVEIVDYH